MMKLLFVGLGSIGQRHLLNSYNLLGNNATFHALRSSGKLLPEKIEAILSNVYSNHEEISEDYDVIFITNPTSLHYKSLLDLTKKTKSFFIEKPVFDRTDLDVSFLDNEIFTYVACPLRYTQVISKLKEIIKEKNVRAVRVICSTYLPDWRPNQDYRQTYSAHSELGGGVEIDLIHEWDYIYYLFGQPSEVSSYFGKVSNLEIDSNDLAIYIAKYQDKMVSVHLDYFGQSNKREIELYFDDEVIVGDLINSKLIFLKEKRTLELSQQRNDFQILELEHFFNMFQKKSRSTNSIEDALKVLKIAKGE